MANGSSNSKNDILHRFGVKTRDLIQLCKKHGVKSLFVFGSVIQDKFESGVSDIDFLVEFNSVSIDRFFDFQDGLKNLFQYENIDLVTLGSLKNKIIRKEILSSREKIYAA